MRTRKFLSVLLGAVMLCGILSGCGGNGGNYDKNDKYYNNNDHDNDGYINDNEFQDAVGDWMDDHGY